MKVGFVALGKLGLPCAVATAMKGHDVMGYDIDQGCMTHFPKPYQEAGPDGTGHFNDYLKDSPVRFADLQTVVDHSEILFCSVQTPHHVRYEGITRIPEERVDFDYHYLKKSIMEIAHCCEMKALRQRDEGGEPTQTVIVIISTVLPGTMRREILPLCNHHMDVAYNPFFIAMGTTMRDFLHPEFILLGMDSETAAAKVARFYSTITEAKVFICTVENAELIKVCYNTFIGAKIAFANVVQEICHKSPNCDAHIVMDALKGGYERLTSPAYMSPGMGDGGGCHPRDNIALSWLARRLDLSADWFEKVMLQREAHCDFLADVMEEWIDKTGMAGGIMGTAFKAHFNMTIGSPAILLHSIMEERGRHCVLYDPWVKENSDIGVLKAPRVWLMGTNHKDFYEKPLPVHPGSLILDPWKMVPLNDNYQVVTIGIGPGLPQG
jgi:UDPglucose 6-dehydrogenase